MSGRTNDLSSELIRAFSILELPPSADFGAVKTAYRELAKVWHPDRFEGDVSTQNRAQEKLKQINSAFETLETFFARQPSPHSPEVTGNKHGTGIYPPVPQYPPIPQQPRNARGNQPGQNVKSAPMLIGLMLVGIIVIVVVSIAQQEGQTGNRNQVAAPGHQTEPLTPEGFGSRATTQEAQPASTVAETPRRTGGLTAREKEQYLRLEGYDPAIYEIDEYSNIVKKKTTTNTHVQPAIQLPKNVKFVILADGEQYFTEKEPKPFGSGFKLTDVLRKVDVVVTGNIQIIKVTPAKN